MQGCVGVLGRQPCSLGVRCECFVAAGAAAELLRPMERSDQLQEEERKKDRERLPLCSAEIIGNDSWWFPLFPLSPACSSLCVVGPGAASSSSLMYSVMKLASGVAPDSSTVQRLAFSLLANLAVSRECRGVLQKVQQSQPAGVYLQKKTVTPQSDRWRHILRPADELISVHAMSQLTSHVCFHFRYSKNNFLQGFVSVPTHKATGARAASAGGGGGGGGHLLGQWLLLLVSLSFAEDGQQNILRVTGTLELLADLALHRHHALLTLHNLCFCPANKPHVLASGMKGIRGFRFSQITAVAGVIYDAFFIILLDGLNVACGKNIPYLDGVWKVSLLF